MLLHMFSSNAPPFEADTSYTKFEAYVRLNYGGDRSLAALELAEQRRHLDGTRRVACPTMKQNRTFGPNPWTMLPSTAWLERWSG